MKKHFFIYFLILKFTIACAQIDSNEIIWNAGRNLFSNLNKQKISSGFLEDYSFNSLPMERLNGRIDTITKLSMFQEVYSKFEYMNIGNNPWRDWDSIKKVANSYTEKGINPILIFFQDYERIKPDAFEQGLLDTLEGKLMDISSLNNTPFELKSVFLAATWCYSMGSNETIKICVPRSLLIGNKYNSNYKIYLNYSNQRMELIPDSVYEIKAFSKPLTPGFAQSNEQWTVSAELPQSANGEIVDLKSHFNVGLVEEVSDFPGVFWEPIAADIPWSNEFAKGIFVTRYGKGNPDNCIRKPFIFIDGIDFGYKIDPNWSKCVDGKCNTNGFIDVYTGIDHNRETGETRPIPEFQHGKVFFDKLFEDGFDVIFLDFENGADYTQRNAMLLVKLIQEINNRKCTNEEIVICGASMGGQVARYGLLYMEEHKMKHCVRNSIYFDSPHKGANIPLGLQLFMEYFANHNYGGEFSDCVDNLNRKLNRPAAKQLLVHHVSSGYERKACWEHDAFYNEMQQMGGFPKNCRKIAIPSGSTTGKKLDFKDGELLFDMKVPVRLKEVSGQKVHLLFLPFHLMHGAAEGFRIKSKFYAMPGNLANNNLIFKADGDGRGNVQDFHGTSGMLNWDNMPGGTNDGIKDLNISEKITKHITFNALIPKTVTTSFIPTNSSMALTTYDFNANISNLISDNESPRPAEYSFDAYYLEDSNYSHVSMTITGGSSFEHPGNVGWVIWEANRTGNLLSELPANVNYISKKNATIINKYVYNYNFADGRRNILNSVMISNKGSLGVNNFKPANFGFTDDFNNTYVASFEGQTKMMRTSECGAEVEIKDGGIFQLGDNNGPVNNKAEVHFRDGSYLHLYKGSKLIIHNGSKLIIEPGASLYLDDEDAIKFEGPDAVLEIQGELIVKPGIRLSITQNGYLKFSNGEDGKSHVKLDMDPSTVVELSSLSNEKRLEVGDHFILEWPKNIQVILKGSQIETGKNSSIVFNGPVELNDAEFYGSDKSDKILIQTSNENDVKIMGCSFSGYNVGLDFSKVSHYKMLKIENCQFEMCNTGIHTISTGLNLKGSKFNGCIKAWLAEKVNYASELYYCNFYMNQFMVDYVANVTSAELLLSWVTGTVAGLKMNQTSNVNSRISIRCSNFKNCSFELNDVRVNMSSTESHNTMNGQGLSVIHAGKNVFDNSPIQLGSIWNLNLALGKNDFSSKVGSQYIYGTIENANFNGNLSIDENFFDSFNQGGNFNVNYINSGRIVNSLPVNIQGNLANNNFGGCSGTGGKDGDGLKPEIPSGATEHNGITCFPNPSSRELIIEANGFVYNSIRIFDISGRLLANLNSLENGSILKVIDVSAMPSGLYLLEVSDVHGVSKKLKFSVSH